mmetsp:Transcript_23249/g.42144  ORF Transcript_23249/g.42144 Transcript_23249/m.42144 type:complete len:90 (-) Transcript_23249:288-557(-)
MPEDAKKKRDEKKKREASTRKENATASFIAAMTPKGPENNQGNDVETNMFIPLNLIIVCIDGCSRHELPCVGSWAPWDRLLGSTLVPVE